jgi:hypothetical protein
VLLCHNLVLLWEYIFSYLVPHQGHLQRLTGAEREAVAAQG